MAVPPQTGVKIAESVYPRGSLDVAVAITWSTGSAIAVMVLR